MISKLNVRDRMELCWRHKNPTDVLISKHLKSIDCKRVRLKKYLEVNLSLCNGPSRSRRAFAFDFSATFNQK